MRTYFLNDDHICSTRAVIRGHGVDNTQQACLDGLENLIFPFALSGDAERVNEKHDVGIMIQFVLHAEELEDRRLMVLDGRNIDLVERL